MKKVLSLVLAVIMLMSMAISSSALTIWGSTSKEEEESSLKDLIYNLYLHGNGFVPGSPDHGNVSGNDWWYGDCKECDGDAFYYRDLNTIYWKCLESDCGKHGSNSPEIDRWWAGECGYCHGTAFYYMNEDTIYWRCAEDDCGRKGQFNLGGSEDDEDEDEEEEEDKDDGILRCGECGFPNPTFISTYVKDGKIYNEYYCRFCMRSIVKLVDINDLGLNVGASAKITSCNASDCKNLAYFDQYSVEDERIFLVYKCKDGHTTKRMINDCSFDTVHPSYGDYTVSVYCSTGGSYTITNGRYAFSGERKTVNFYAKPGYTLTDVTINGFSVGPRSSITFTTVKNMVITATFTKNQNIASSYTITANKIGNGTITAKKNSASVEAGIVLAKHNDTVTYSFSPAVGYKISSVKVDGKEVGAVRSYTFSKLDANHNIQVTFTWNNTYTDVIDHYLPAVKYVSETGIMSFYGSINRFSGYTYVSIKDFAVALAEMADTDNKLNTIDQRLAWAVIYGLVNVREEDITSTITVQRACDMVKVYLEVVEKINGIDFTLVDDKDSAKETAIEIKMVTDSIYTKNRRLYRYDLAAVCYLISTLKYTK